MPKPKKVRSRKRKIKVSQKARIKKKSEQAKDTIPKASARVYPENAAHIKIKIRKK